MLHACARDRFHDERQALLQERAVKELSHRGLLSQGAHHDVLPGGCCGEPLGIVEVAGGNGEVLVCSQKCARLIGVAYVGGDRVPLLEGLADEEAAGAAGCAENQYFHMGSLIFSCYGNLQAPNPVSIAMRFRLGAFG